MFKSIKIPQLLQQAYIQKSELERMLILSVTFSIGLNLFRTLYTGRASFYFLIWNLFLAAVPYFISRALLRHPQWIENRLKFWPAFTCWLLFVPNSFYILTDLFHLHERPEVPLWFDLALIFSFAWNGLLLGILSVRQMEKIVEVKLGLRSELLFLLPIMFLNALGIFIGRYLCYNSWDVVTNPLHLHTTLFPWSFIRSATGSTGA
jgi:uncharacterized membrane protein